MDFKEFRFTDPRQERIYRRLRLIGPGPAAFYRDACRLMSYGSSLDTTPHLVAHSLREIESALRTVLLPHDFVPPEECSTCGNRPEAHKRQIKAIARAYGLESTVAAAWSQLVGREEGGLARLAHRNALLSPRQINEVLSKTWDEAEALFDTVLAKFETDFLRSFELLDGLLAKPSPGANDVKRLKNKVPNNLVTLGYFFDKLENPAWLDLLRKEGFLKHPPEPRRDEETGTLEVQPWPESRFLARMAALPDWQEKVVEIALEIPDTENLYVHEDLIDIALALPAKLAAHLTPKAEDWLQSPRHVLLPEKLGKLISQLAKGNETKAALELTCSLLAVVPGPQLGNPSQEKSSLYRLRAEPQARFGLWHYDQIVKKNLPDLVSAAGMEAFSLLCNLLETTVGLARSAKGEGPEDYSYIWRPRVDDLGETHRHRVRDVLVAAVRDAAKQIAKADPRKVYEIVKELDGRPWRIFYRIALHILHIFPDAAPDLIATKLTDQNSFTDLGRQDEYRSYNQKVWK